MNRAERRRQQRAEKDGVINIKKQELNKIKEDATQEAVQRAFGMMLYTVAIVLRDKYGFGKKRLDVFVDYVLDQFESIQQNYVSFEDLREAILAETGVEIERKMR